jgi:putative flavoprotein involved in K+ transport
MTEVLDVVVIGGGQAGLALAYYLQRAGTRFVVLDNSPVAGGAWPYAWDSLRLFSPAEYSSLPGWQMPRAWVGEYPTRDEVVAYLTRYEERYRFPIQRPVQVHAVTHDGKLFHVSSSERTWTARAVISATGTWSSPYLPDIEGQELFAGTWMHSASYRSPDGLAGQSVIVVGGGNSGAQIHAEVSQVAESLWVTQVEPTFLPDDVDGRVLFDRASARVRGVENGASVGSLGDIVMVPPVREARERGDLRTVRPFKRFTESGVEWPDGTRFPVDVVIWCTGFGPALEHLQPLGVIEADGKVAVANGASLRLPGLFLAGYGNWVSPASATLIGAGRSARELVPAIVTFVGQ